MANELKLNSPLIVNGATTLNQIVGISPNTDTRILDLTQFSASPSTSSSYITLKNSIGAAIGLIDYQANFLAGDGSVSQPGLGFKSQTGIGIYRIGSSILGVATGGSERIRVDSSGNVGIGNTSPNEKLDVGNGNIRLSNNGTMKFSDNQGSPNFVNIKAPTTVTASYNLTLPNAQGGINQVIVNTDGAGTLGFASVPVGSTGDISQLSFSIANNTSSATNVTGLAFANASVQSALVQYSIIINATTSLYEAGTLQLIQKGSSWEMSQTTVGDNSLVVLTVTTAGQIQYTSANYAGFTSAKMQFRANVTSV